MKGIHDYNRTNGANQVQTNMNIHVAIIKTSLYSFLFTLGVFGNIMVVIATYKFITLRKPTNILICNLCVSDILILLLGIPLFAFDIKTTADLLGVAGCKTLQPLCVAFVTSTVLTLLSIALERYIAIVHPMSAKRQLKTSTAYIAVFIINVFSISCGLPLCFALYMNPENVCDNGWEKLTKIAYRMVLFFVDYLFPLVAMSVLYSRSWQRIRSKNKKTIDISRNNRGSIKDNDTSSKCRSECDETLFTPPGDPLRSGSNNHLAGTHGTIRRTQSVDSVISEKCHKVNLSRCSLRGSSASIQRGGTLRSSATKLRRSMTSLIAGADIEEAMTVVATSRFKQTMLTLKMFIYILVVFSICMLPHQIVELADTTGYTIPFNSYGLLHLLLYVNAAINPWLYAGMNKQYRRAYRRLFNRKSYSVAHLVKRNLFRSPSGTLILSEKDSKYSCFCLAKALFPLYQKKSTISGDHESVTPSTVSSPKMRQRKTSDLRDRKSSKASYKESSATVVESDIPICAPIIIITCYDDEIEQEKKFL